MYKTFSGDDIGTRFSWFFSEHRYAIKPDPAGYRKQKR